MGRIGITFQEVKKAIAELQGKQKNPTVDSIREILGTGSKSTIARFLREWRAQHGLQSDDEARLPSDLLGIVQGLWDTLCDKADQQIEAYRQGSDSKVADMQQHLIQSRQLETTLRQNVHSLEEQLHRQKEETQQLKRRLIAEEQDKIRMAERVAALEARRHENQAENQRLHQLLKHVQENLEHYQASTQKLREEQSLLLEKQQNEYDQRLSLLLTQAHTAVQEKSVCQGQYEHLTKIHESLVVEHSTLEKQHIKHQEQYGSLKVTHSKLQEDYDRLKEQIQVQASELAATQRIVAELQLYLKQRDQEIASLEEKLAKANDKIETLRHESQFVLQEKAGLEGQLKQMQKMLLSGQVVENVGC